MAYTLNKVPTGSWEADVSRRYREIRARRVRGNQYKRECNLGRRMAQALARLHRAYGYTARIRKMITSDDVRYNVYLDHPPYTTNAMRHSYIHGNSPTIR